MSIIDEAREQTYKLIIAGPVGAGKTAAIQVLSDKGVVTTDEVASDDVKLMKKTTTVAMDYGVMILDSGEQVRLYGTPGQRRFDFMWEILSENALGLILLLNAEEKDPVGDLDYYLDAFSPLIKGSALVVGVTHAENMPWDLHDALSERLVERGVAANVMVVDARDREEMRRMVRSLIYMISS
ncbi:ATP/GTP-binding protein [Moraxella bovis]|uniref:GTP-binding protein n=1 Tax=Moraxella bovis TaxID=476 RepID=UPI002225FFD1|nr:ATP/GTP-binding protein [Moraxella bovis]UYZ71861.1 ATP/GTP-binding protein [Moraxella bovis]UZA15158.1 ATP/GTP-binding protein [Moraxella bovis]UZA26486.1 ATP/GTP-binding protein [Moraxella bovis]UZA38984.1 ATP/GTP-binding protein [Moraxella bovis]UZA42105.1 ATP/GTP-binding protein [Moraxella bovis]